MTKELRISVSPVPMSTDTEVEMAFEGHEIGSVTLTEGFLADFIEALREGFRVIVAAGRREERRRDAGPFAEPDEQDD